jgi:predicted protein tyrosine phosphatase
MKFQGEKMNNKIIDIQVMSKSKAKQFKSDVAWAAISISSDEGMFADLNEDHRVDVLRLCFLDRNFEDPNNFTDLQANQIIDFTYEVLPKIECLLVHCEFGASRSPAVAAALAVSLWGPNTDRVYFKKYTPNTYVYNKILEAHNSRFNS